MTPAILQADEARAWLRSLGLRGVRLPKADKALHVVQPGGGYWKVILHESGGYLVEAVQKEAS